MLNVIANVRTIDIECFFLYIRVLARIILVKWVIAYYLHFQHKCRRSSCCFCNENYQIEELSKPKNVVDLVSLLFLFWLWCFLLSAFALVCRSLCAGCHNNGLTFYSRGYYESN